MGKKLDALLGRTFKTSKFKGLVNLAISRLAVLKNQKQTRSSLARSDVVQLLNLGHQDRALLRVEQVIKEQNMVDVFSIIEGYCLLLSERVKLIEHDNKSLSPSIMECPDELKEAISSLIFAASRCGEFPELQQIRAIFTSRYGKEFTSRAVELRNNCGVNPKMIQKLSTRLPSLEARMEVLKKIASENGIALQLEEEAPTVAPEENLNRDEGNKHKHDRSFSSNDGESGANLKEFPQVVDQVEGFSTSSMNRRRQYKDVADAAQEAFISAAYAAAAARAAVELSKSSPRAPDDLNNQTKQIFNSNYDAKPMPEKGQYSGEYEDDLLRDDKVNPFDTYSLDSKDEDTKEGAGSPLIKQTKLEDRRNNSPLTSPRLFGSDIKSKRENVNSMGDENPWGGRTVPYFPQKQTESTSSDGSRTYQNSQSSAGLEVKTPLVLNSGRPVSVRTRR